MNICKRHHNRAHLVILGLACAALLRPPGSRAETGPAVTNALAAPKVKAAQGDKRAAPAKPKAKQTRILSGAELYSMHCNRCHPERYPTERTAAQWKTIMLHMRVRANLPGQEAKTILKYLQENSGR